MADGLDHTPVTPDRPPDAGVPGPGVGRGRRDPDRDRGHEVGDGIGVALAGRRPRPRRRRDGGGPRAGVRQGGDGRLRRPRRRDLRRVELRPGRSSRSWGKPGPVARCGVKVGPGQAVEITTGSALPDGADAVVKVESTATSADGLTVSVVEPTPPGKHVGRRGEDVAAGTVVFARDAGSGRKTSACSSAAGAGRGRGRPTADGLGDRHRRRASRPGFAGAGVPDQRHELGDARRPGRPRRRDRPRSSGRSPTTPTRSARRSPTRGRGPTWS